MRRFVVSMFPLALLLACGGGEKPAENPQGATPDGGSSSSSSGAATEAADAGPASTTTVLVGDAGELQGSKLTSNATVTVQGTSTPSQGIDPKHHDPGRSPEDIITIIKSHRDEARACYDAAVKTHPGIEGNLDITWKLDPKGKVTETGVDASKSDIHEPGLIKCIGDVIRKIPWAASPRGVETSAHYPFNFHPHGPQH
ncbi:MAG TPA: AgmX/PglI C-terminal domain-containing protein [Polyangiaceae bacterium]|nr:AgmX/PglI C-terminal domain-containing protein [Polyangiaceae bacterium]